MNNGVLRKKFAFFDFLLGSKDNRASPEFTFYFIVKELTPVGVKFKEGKIMTVDLNVIIDTLWVVIASVLVFSMQAGFALVESGFTRSKNAANIMMKNFMDYSIGALVFFRFWFSLMFNGSILDYLGHLIYSFQGITVDWD